MELLGTNAAALATMNRIAMFGDTGATLIIIHHTTKDSNGEMKIKGNSTTISSKADTTILFTRNGDERTMEVLNTRAEDKIATGTQLKYKLEKRANNESFKVPA